MNHVIVHGITRACTAQLPDTRVPGGERREGGGGQMKRTLEVPLHLQGSTTSNKTLDWTIVRLFPPHPAWRLIVHPDPFALSSRHARLLPKRAPLQLRLPVYVDCHHGGKECTSSTICSPRTHLPSPRSLPQPADTGLFVFYFCTHG